MSGAEHRRLSRHLDDLGTDIINYIHMPHSDAQVGARRLLTIGPVVALLAQHITTQPLLTMCIAYNSSQQAYTPHVQHT